MKRTEENNRRSNKMSKLDEISDDVQEALEITSLVFALLAKCDMYTDEALEMAAEHLEHNVEHCEMDGYRDAAHNLLLLATIIRNGIVDSNGVPIGTNPNRLTNKPETTEEPVEENRSTLDLLKQRAEQGYAWAQNELGFMYNNGEGVEQDHEEAERWYRLAAEQGHAVAQFNLGLMYRDGRGVAQDYVEAVRLFRLAAEQGIARSQTNLGNMYYLGQGVAQDDAEAVRLFRLAAKQDEQEEAQ